MKILTTKESPGITVSRKGWKESAFSLIEVTISVAITAVALVSLMGMLPAGMRTMAKATDTAIEARIHQQVVGEVMLTEWPKRFDFDNIIRGYDDQGIHIATGGTVFAAGRTDNDIIYRARIRIPTQDVVLPGGDPDPNLQLVLVDISNLSVSNFNFDSAENQRHIHTYQSMTVKMDESLDRGAITGGGGN